MGDTIHGTVSVLLCMPHMFVFVSSQVSDMEMWVALYMEQYLYYCVCLTCLCLCLVKCQTWRCGWHYTWNSICIIVYASHVCVWRKNIIIRRKSLDTLLLYIYIYIYIHWCFKKIIFFLKSKCELYELDLIVQR